jgi:hypothetical protein
MMEYLCPLYIQKFSLLTQAPSAAHLSVFRTLKRTHALSVSIIDSLRGFLVIFVPLKNARARACMRARSCSRIKELAPFFSLMIMSRRCGSLYCGSGFSLPRFFWRCYAPFLPRSLRNSVSSGT